MTIAFHTTSTTHSRPSRLAPCLSPRTARVAMTCVVIASIAGSFLATDPQAVSLASTSAGDDLTRLLRFMAALKGLLAVGAAGAVFWRLGVAITPGRFAAYAAACGAMMAGPGLIWGMAHVGLGALMLHGGLLASVVLIWRDPATVARLKQALRSSRNR